MNSWPNELMAECHRLRIMEEVKQIRLEKLALKSRVDRPGIFGRAMFNVGNWMISAGQELRKRHEVGEKKTVYEGMPKEWSK